jgi:hypothetical protein
MDQVTFLALLALASGTTLATVRGLLGDWEVLGASFGLVVWLALVQQSFAVQIYSGGTLAATKTYVSVAALAAILAFVHLVITIESSSMLLRDRGVFFNV